jgi:acetyltransferase
MVQPSVSGCIAEAVAVDWEKGKVFAGGAVLCVGRRDKKMIISLVFAYSLRQHRRRMRQGRSRTVTGEHSIDGETTMNQLNKIFHPERVAVIGASEHRASVGYAVLRNLLASPFREKVWPVHPEQDTVQGLRAYARVADLPRPPDLAVVCTPARTVPHLVRECGEAGVGGLIVISAGFEEAGGEGKGLVQQVREQARRFPDMRLIGPNCLGVIVPATGLNASFAGALPQPGRIAFVSQSGALGTAIVDWAIEQQIGLSAFVSVGNMLNVGFADLVEYFGHDPATRALILYIEALTDAQRFLAVARTCTQTKPIVAYKAGRFAESAKAAASHTGALTGADEVYQVAFQRAGIERVMAIEEMFDCAELLAHQRPPAGARLAIVTNAGGPAIVATDVLMARRGVLATLSAGTMARLNQLLPPAWSHGNPVDILGDAAPERFAEATRVVLADPETDAVLVILTPQAMTEPTAIAQAVAAAAAQTSKLVLAAWMGGHTIREGMQLLNAHGVPTYDNPEKAVCSFLHLTSYVHNQAHAVAVGCDEPRSLDLHARQRRERCRALLERGGALLSEVDAKALLAAYEIAVTSPSIARSVTEAVACARELGYPVVMKIFSPQISHKTEVGGVRLNLQTGEEVRAAYQHILAVAQAHAPDAEIQGVTLQRMVSAAQGFEMIVGAKKDATFGPVILLGAGGVATELFRDTALNLPPLNEALVRQMLESLHSWPLLTGFRGRPALNVTRLIETVLRFTALVCENPEIKEVDINPLLVTPDEVIALDARVVREEQTSR